MTRRSAMAPRVSSKAGEPGSVTDRHRANQPPPLPAGERPTSRASEMSGEGSCCTNSALTRFARFARKPPSPRRGEGKIGSWFFADVTAFVTIAPGAVNHSGRSRSRLATISFAALYSPGTIRELTPPPLSTEAHRDPRFLAPRPHATHRDVRHSQGVRPGENAG